jgi:glyoxylase-like metal-dependent hydrolase (beta-lactamase superfamily II)
MGEWEDATHPNERNRASYLEPDFVPLAEARQLETVQGQAEVAPGVHVVPVGGHTAYHQMVIVEGGRQALVIPTDLVPTAAHLPLPYIMGYDLFPVGTLEAKRRVLKDAAERGSTLLFYHDVKTPLAKIKLEKDRYVLAGATA